MTTHGIKSQYNNCNRALVSGNGETHTKKLEWLKVSSCSVTPSSRKMLPSTSTANPSASPVMEADMPSPTYLELQTTNGHVHALLIWYQQPLP